MRQARERYRARAIEGDYGKAGTGTEQVAILFDLENGERLTWYGFLSDKSIDRTLEALKACGVQDLETLAGLGSQEVEVEVEDDEWDGKPRRRVAFVNALGSGAIRMKEKLPEGARKAFAASMKGKWLAMGGGQKPPEPEPETVSDDDIPF